MLLRGGRNARVPPLFLLFIDWNSAIALPVAAFAGTHTTPAISSILGGIFSLTK